jgi:tetrahydromethanopterin S-methyltransferase subunit G
LEAHTRVEEEGLVRFTAALNELTERVDEIAEVHTAFPKDEEGTRDFKGHRHYHARLNAGEEKQDDFWSRMKEEVGKNVVTAILIIFALGINSYINKISHETPPQHETAKQDK